MLLYEQLRGPNLNFELLPYVNFTQYHTLF